MLKKYFVALLALGVTLVSTMTSAKELSFEVNSETYSGPYTIDGLLHNLRGDLSSGNAAFTFNEVKQTYIDGNWSIAVLARADYLLEFNDDTAALIYQIENDFAPEIGRQYDLDLQAEHIIGTGVQLGYKWELDNSAWLSAEVSLLKTSKIMSGSLSGTWQETGSDQLTDLYLDYHFSKDLLFKEPVSHSDGKGIALDVSGFWQYSDRISADFKVKDLFSRIRWSDVPYNRVTANSSSNVSIIDGKVNVTPILSGYKGVEDYTQKLPQRWLVGANYQEGSHLFRSEVFYVAGFVFPRLKYQFNSNHNVSYSTGYDFKTDALSLGANYRGLKLNVSADKLSLKKANNLVVSAALKVPL